MSSKIYSGSKSLPILENFPFSAESSVIDFISRAAFTLRLKTSRQNGKLSKLPRGLCCRFYRPRAPAGRPYPAGIHPAGSAYPAHSLSAGRPYPAHRPLVQGVSGKIPSGPGIYVSPIKTPLKNGF